MRVLTELTDLSTYIIVQCKIKLKLLRTYLKNCVLGTSTAAIFLSNDHSLYSLIYLGWTSCLISFTWEQSTCQERVENDKIQSGNFLPTMGLDPQPWYLKSDVLPTELTGLDKSCTIYITFIHTCTSDTRSGRIFGLVCMLKANTGLVRRFAICIILDNM